MDIDYSQFSEREKEVISLLLQGKSNKQIALALNISQSTVEYHLKNIYQKLDVSSRTEAVLRLGKSEVYQSQSELRESTHEPVSKAVDRDVRPISRPKIPKNKLYRGIGVLLIIILFLTVPIPFNRPTQNAEAPPPTSMEWQDQIVYILNSGKFSDGNPSTRGGDLAGIKEKMDYLKGLGITSIVLNVFSPGDFQRIDPNLGTDEEFAQLIDKAHSTADGPRVNIILDVRFRVDESSHMPILNDIAGMVTGTDQYNEVRDAIFSLVDHFEIDGLHYSFADEVHPVFWSQFMSDFRAEYDQKKPDFWHIAEVYVDPLNPAPWQIRAEEFVDQTSSIRMDSIYDFATPAHIQEVFANGKNPKCIPSFGDCANLLSDLLNAGATEPVASLMASVDSIFFSFLGEIPDDVHAKQKLYLASIFLFTINRVPLIFSRNEYAIGYTPEPDVLFTSDLDETFHEKYKKLIQIRRGYAVFQWGDLVPMNTDDKTIISYARKDENETFIVVLNNKDAPDSLEIELGAEGITCSRVENLLVENFRLWNYRDIQLRNPGMNDTVLNVKRLDPWEAEIIHCEH